MLAHGTSELQSSDHLFCPGCHSRLPPGHDIDTLYASDGVPNPTEGEVWKIRESLFLPVARELEGSQALWNLAEQRSLRATSRFYDKHHGCKEQPRPCIILEHVGNWEFWVHLMGTVDGGDIRAGYPYAMKHFSAEVDPVNPADAAHLHISPQWHRRPAWVIVVPFKTKPGLSEDQGHVQPQRWTSRRNGGHTFMLQQEEMERLERLTEARRGAWQMLLSRRIEEAKKHLTEFDYALRHKTWQVSTDSANVKSDNATGVSQARHTTRSSPLRQSSSEDSASAALSTQQRPPKQVNPDKVAARYSACSSTTNESDTDSSGPSSPETSLAELHDRAGVVSAVSDLELVEAGKRSLLGDRPCDVDSVQKPVTLSRAQWRKETKSSGASLKPGSTRSRRERFLDDLRQTFAPVFPYKATSIRSKLV